MKVKCIDGIEMYLTHGKTYEASLSNNNKDYYHIYDGLSYLGHYSSDRFELVLEEQMFYVRMISSLYISKNNNLSRWTNYKNNAKQFSASDARKVIEGYKLAFDEDMMMEKVEPEVVLVETNDQALAWLKEKKYSVTIRPDGSTQIIDEVSRTNSKCPCWWGTSLVEATRASQQYSITLLPEK